MFSLDPRGGHNRYKFKTDFWDDSNFFIVIIYQNYFWKENLMFLKDIFICDPIG